MKNIDIARSCLHDIYSRHKKLTAEIIIDEAKVKEHPLHDYFEWNDTVAAEKFRLAQANALVRTLKIAVITPANKYKLIREFVNLSSERNTTTYTPLTEIQANDKQFQEMIRQYAKDACSYMKRLSNIVEIPEFSQWIENELLPMIDSRTEQAIEQRKVLFTNNLQEQNG